MESGKLGGGEAEAFLEKEESRDPEEVTEKQVGAVQIVISTEEHNFELDVEALESVLLQEDIKNLPVAIVSVAGAFRKGKSFILDFFIRYLRSGVRNI